MVKIRLTRAGAKKHAFFRIVAIDQRKPREGRPLEFLGTYDPCANPESIRLKSERLEAWVAKGAQMSPTVRSLVRRAARQPQAPAAAAGEAS
jgi:small subunit ribosomal protein S16